MSNVRVVRPRPLAVDDRIPVYWAGREAPPQIRAVDGGTLYEHLAACETQDTQQRKRHKGGRYKAPKEGIPSTPGDRTGLTAARHIAIPNVRDVPDYALNQAAMALKRPHMQQGDVASAPYVRHQEALLGMYEEEAAEYDMDDEDEVFLVRVNHGTAPKAAATSHTASKDPGKGPALTKANSNGLMAAARGLYQHVASRFLSSPGSTGPANAAAGNPAAAAAAAAAAAGAGAGPSRSVSESGAQQLPKDKLTPDEFERAFDRLELAHFEALKDWWQRTQDGPSTSTAAAAALPKLPALKTLLPRARAASVLPDLEPKLAVAVYEHWAKRRAQEGGPLLQRLWFEQPWKLLAFAYLADEEDSDPDEHLPFTATEPRSHRERRPGNARRKLSDEDAMENLLGLRGELEVVRTLADQVRKREKMKRQLMLLWQQEWRVRASSGRVPTAAEDERRRQQLQGLGGDVAAGAGAQRRQAAAAAAAMAAAAARAAEAAAEQAGPSRQPGAAAAVPTRNQKAAAAAGAAAAGKAADVRKRGRAQQQQAAAPAPKRLKPPNIVLNGALSTSEAPVAPLHPHSSTSDHQADSAVADSAEVDSRRARRAARTAAAAAAAATAAAAAASHADEPKQPRHKNGKLRPMPSNRAAAAGVKPPSKQPMQKQAQRRDVAEAASPTALRHMAPRDSPPTALALRRPGSQPLAARLARSPSGGAGKRWGHTGPRTPRSFTMQGTGEAKRGSRLRLGVQKQLKRGSRASAARQQPRQQPPHAAGNGRNAAAQQQQQQEEARQEEATELSSQQRGAPLRRPAARGRQAAAATAATTAASKRKPADVHRGRSIGRRELMQLGLNVPPAVPEAAAESAPAAAAPKAASALIAAARKAAPKDTKQARAASRALVARALARATPQKGVRKRVGAGGVQKAQHGGKQVGEGRGSGPRTPSLRELIQLVPDRPSSPPRDRRRPAAMKQ